MNEKLKEVILQQDLETFQFFRRLEKVEKEGYVQKELLEEAKKSTRPTWDLLVPTGFFRNEKGEILGAEGFEQG